MILKILFLVQAEKNMVCLALGIFSKLPEENKSIS